MRPKRVLYAVQGTGNGHVARARQIIPLLAAFATVDVWLGGNQSEVALPVTPKYFTRGLVMHYNKKGGVSYIKTLIRNNYADILREIINAPVKGYDLVLNDFESTTAWACKLRNIPCIALGHQASFRHPETPRPRFKQWLGEAILRWYAPANRHIGFHFRSYTASIYPPVLRQEIRAVVPENKGHITVYLPAYHPSHLLPIFNALTPYTFHVFTKHVAQITYHQNVQLHPIHHENFTNSMSGSFGVLCGAGFETPAEALYLGKKLMVVPIRNQYEQLCNAAALRMEGVHVLHKLSKKSIPAINSWLQSAPLSPANYPDFTRELLFNLVNDIPLREV